MATMRHHHGIHGFRAEAAEVDYICPWCGTGRVVKAADIATRVGDTGRRHCTFPPCPGCGVYHSFPTSLRAEHEDAGHVASGYDPHYADYARHLRALCKHLGVHAETPLWMHLPPHLAAVERRRWHAAHAAAGTALHASAGAPSGRVADPPGYTVAATPPASSQPQAGPQAGGAPPDVGAGASGKGAGGTWPDVATATTTAARGRTPRRAARGRRR